MRKKKKLFEDTFWATLFAIDVPAHLNELPSHLHHVRMRLWDKVIDEYLELMVTQVKSINMLDLDETDITNDGVAHLTQMNFIKELRLKGIREIDNHCIVHLNKIKGLELIHVKGTSVTIDGILKLDSKPGLKELFFSAKDGEITNEKMLELKKLMPGCSFTIDAKSYYFDEPSTY